MPLPLENLPRPVRRIIEDENTWLAVALSWLLAPALLTLTFFYLGTIMGPHYFDLTVWNMENGARTAGFGLLLGVAFATVVTLWYPRVRRREEALAGHEPEPIDPQDAAAGP